MYNLIEYSSNYSKDETTDFNNNIENTDNGKSFKNKAEFLENSVAQPDLNNANGLLKYATIAVH